MARRILGVLAGVVAGVVAIMIVEMIGHAVYPLPPGLDPRDREAIAAFIKSAPLGVMLFVLAAYAIGSFVAGLLARLLGRTRPPALVAGAILMALGVVNLVMIPHPVWFWAVSLVLYVPLAWAGAASVRSRPKPPPDL